LVNCDSILGIVCYWSSKLRAPVMEQRPRSLKLGGMGFGKPTQLPCDRLLRLRLRRSRPSASGPNKLPSTAFLFPQIRHSLNIDFPLLIIKNLLRSIEILLFLYLSEPAKLARSINEQCFMMPNEETSSSIQKSGIMNTVARTTNQATKDLSHQRAHTSQNA
jgi:hypothetical protein